MPPLPKKGTKRKISTVDVQKEVDKVVDEPVDKALFEPEKEVVEESKLEAAEVVKLSEVRLSVKTISMEAQCQLNETADLLAEMSRIVDKDDVVTGTGFPDLESFATNMHKLVKKLHESLSRTSGRTIALNNGRRAICAFSTVQQGRPCLGCKLKMPGWKKNNSTTYYCTTCCDQFNVQLFFCGNCRANYTHYADLVMNTKKEGFIKGADIRDFINQERMKLFEGPILYLIGPFATYVKLQLQRTCSCLVMKI
jgi:hypothetical protein